MPNATCIFVMFLRSYVTCIYLCLCTLLYYMHILIVLLFYSNTYFIRCASKLFCAFSRQVDVANLTVSYIWILWRGSSIPLLKGLSLLALVALSGQIIIYLETMYFIYILLVLLFRVENKSHYHYQLIYLSPFTVLVKFKFIYLPYTSS